MTPGRCICLTTGDPAQDWSPERPRLCNGQEMCLRRVDFIEYLENLMSTVFPLTTQQRSDFITSLLSKISYEEVLFRFLSRDEIQRAITLNVCPVPVLWIRIFLIFGDATSPCSASRDGRGQNRSVNFGPQRGSQGSMVTLNQGFSPVAAAENSPEPDLSCRASVGSTLRTVDEYTQDAMGHNLGAARARYTDWRTVIAGPRAASLLGDWTDPSRFRMSGHQVFQQASRD